MNRKGAISVVVIFLFLLGAILLIMGSSHVVRLTGTTMNPNKPGEVTVHLEVAVKDKPIATITFLNVDQKDAFGDVYIDPWTLRADHFFITSEGKSLPSMLDLASRPPPQKEDMIFIKAGTEFKKEVELDSAYVFLPGTHIYEVQYRGEYSHETLNPGYPLVSNEVSFSYTAK